MPNLDENYFQLTLQLLFPETIQVAVEDTVMALGNMLIEALDMVFVDGELHEA